VINEEFALAQAPHPASGIAYALVAPTLMLHGSPDQKASHLPAILSGKEAWCQGFSEPGAGSDLASLSTLAIREGDLYIVNGQKIWTSGAATAQWMLLLARTNPDAPKHRGLSVLIVDMRAPGISVLPLVQISGDAAFCQVFFDDVRVPTANLVGEEDRGWYVATTTLDFDRSSISLTVGAAHAVAELACFARGAGLLEERPASRLEIADRRLEAEVAILLSKRVAWLQGRGQVANHEASIVKLFGSELRQRIDQAGMRLAGLYSQLWDGAERWPKARGGRLAHDYLVSTAFTIGGGTSEIQRNVIALRGLGMPRQ
jgi:alkylation response protein AidB-like acyl-CoA dehydrogenase